MTKSCIHLRPGVAEEVAQSQNMCLFLQCYALITLKRPRYRGLLPKFSQWTCSPRGEGSVFSGGTVDNGRRETKVVSREPEVGYCLFDSLWY